MQESQAPSRGPWQEAPRSSGTPAPAWSPVDDRTYNVLQALTSTLESIEAYEMYLQEDDNGLFEELLAGERQHADRLLAERGAASRSTDGRFDFSGGTCGGSTSGVPGCECGWGRMPDDIVRRRHPACRQGQLSGMSSRWIRRASP